MHNRCNRVMIIMTQVTQHHSKVFIKDACGRMFSERECMVMTGWGLSVGM